MITITTGVELELTEQARHTLTSIMDRCHEVRTYYGPEEGDRFAASFGIQFARLVGMGGRIMSDSDGLIAVTASGMVVGLVCHNDDRVATCTRNGPNPDGYWTNDMVADYPFSGTWSLNS